MEAGTAKPTASCGEGNLLPLMILHTLLSVPDSIYQAPQTQREAGLQFVREHINEEGILGCTDPGILDYSNYATSYGLRLLHRYGKPSDSTLISKMVNYLKVQQFVDSRGISIDHPGFRRLGIWGEADPGRRNRSY